MLKLIAVVAIIISTIQCCGKFHAKFWKEKADWDYLERYKKAPTSRPFMETYPTTINWWNKSIFGGRAAWETRWFTYTTGKIYIDKAGTYKYYMLVDDGSWFGIDGKEVINQLSRGEGKGQIYLKEGYHDITGFMYE
jgi:hypothetical protein